VEEETAGWIRLFQPDGGLIPTAAERAEAAEAEVAQLKALLRDLDSL